MFFNDMTEVINRALSKNENFLIKEDFNMDIKILNSVNKLKSFCDLFSLTNLIHSENSFIFKSR